MSPTTAGKVTDGCNVGSATGEGTSATARDRDRGPTDTALPAGSGHLTNKRNPTTSFTNTQRDGESWSSSDEENPHVTTFEQDMGRYQSRGKPDGPAKGRPTDRQPQKPPPLNPVPPPPPSSQGVGVKVKRTPAITAYQPTTAVGHGNKRS